MKKKLLKKKTTKHQRKENKVVFFHLSNFEPKAKIESHDRGNGFEPSAIKLWKTVSGAAKRPLMNTCLRQKNNSIPG